MTALTALIALIMWLLVLMFGLLALLRVKRTGAYIQRIIKEVGDLARKDIDAGRPRGWRWEALNVDDAWRRSFRYFWRSVEDACFKNHDFHTRELVPGKNVPAGVGKPD